MTMYLLVLLNEIHKGLLHVWRYKVNLLAQLAMFSLLFVGIGFLMGRGRVDAGVLPSMLVGFVIWYYAFMAIVNMSSSLAIEAQTGTLEQTYMSPAPPGLISWAAHSRRSDHDRDGADHGGCARRDLPPSCRREVPRWCRSSPDAEPRLWTRVHGGRRDAREFKRIDASPTSFRTCSSF